MPSPSRLLQIAAAALAGSLFAACAAHADAVARNATELRDLLRGSATPTVLEPIKTEGWCGPQGCFVDVGELRLDRDKGGFAKAPGGKQLVLVQHKPMGVESLPDIDWTSTDAYRVMAGGQRWGTCMEFTHTGIGKSGVYQRWTSVVLVPFSGDKPAGPAHRFVGYWAGCDSLQAASAGQVLLPVIERGEPKAAKPVRLVNYQCSAKGCEGKVDERIVDGDPAGENGGMSIRAK
ncbi:hypothetical protein PV762_21445 [Mitsuaria sp. CC2]|uniref:hypothetical protein n=1 Tax=Mitsuaria sp. CC2 TaxID=3029186 RepID=UPI003B8CA24D